MLRPVAVETGENKIQCHPHSCMLEFPNALSAVSDKGSNFTVQIIGLTLPDLSEVIDLSLLIVKIQFLWGWACQILGRDKWKIGTKLEKCSISQGFEGEFLLFVLEW